MSGTHIFEVRRICVGFKIACMNADAFWSANRWLIKTNYIVIIFLSYLGRILFFLVLIDCQFIEFCRLSSLPTYYVPKDGPLASYKEYITMLPNIDNPEAFGQHANADITSQIQETRLLFDTLLSLQPQVSTGAGQSKEEKV